MENQNEEKEIYKKWVPKDASSLYMENRLGLINAEDEYDQYKRIMESINLGSALLENGNPLKKEAEDALTNETNYLPKRKMELTSDRVYSISTSGEQTSGIVKVRPEELEKGERCILNQQAERLIWKLRIIDNRIFQELTNKGIISIYGVSQIIERELKKGLENGI